MVSAQLWLRNGAHRSHGLTLPLRNATKKRMVFFNTLGYSDKELQSRFSKNVWPFFLIDRFVFFLC